MSHGVPEPVQHLRHRGLWRVELRGQVCYVAWTCTALTGLRLVCKYLAKNARSAKWAAAGRSKEKIAGVLKELGIDSQPILVADSNDEAALADVAKETKVVITLVRRGFTAVLTVQVGPYALYGSKLVKVCAENGTHYLGPSACSVHR